jgi:TDG/mug DNA glycosylase family protein
MPSQDPASQGFEPVIGGNAKVLILGSLPSQLSLARQEYYANPRNTFWRIMGEIIPTQENPSYETRCNTLTDKGVALWDVLKSSVRPGSLDSAIDIASARENDFPKLLAQHSGIEFICFNGVKARELFDRLVLKLWLLPSGVQLVNLPSSSPAHAAMSFEQKLQLWSVIGRYIDLDEQQEK